MAGYDWWTFWSPDAAGPVRGCLSAGGSRIRPPVPLVDQHPKCQAGLARYRCAGAGWLMGQLAEAARSTIDDPTVLDDGRNFARPLQHSNVGNRIGVPNHNVGELAGGNDADLTFEAHEPGIAARVGNDCFHRRHADLLDEQLRLLAMPTPMAEGRGV